jgi:hypothetical protein
VTGFSSNGALDFALFSFCRIKKAVGEEGAGGEEPVVRVGADAAESLNRRCQDMSYLHHGKTPSKQQLQNISPQPH